MRLSAALVGVLLASGTSSLSTGTPIHTVSTTYATYSGNFTPPYSLAFLGVPYAEPPVGDLRFRNPVPLNTDKFNNTSIIDASSYPPSCVQGTTGRGDWSGDGSEDCLKVNIYTPVNATASSKLPVIFYIHGGGYSIGDPKNYTFDSWINQSPNIVAVTVYYRLSSLGFLSHPSFSNSSLGDNNAGFLDQVEALKWVRQNIGVFGGDPDRITIDGESAGAGSVQMHLVSQESNGLFHGAISQSFGFLSMPKPEQQLDFFSFFAKQAGCECDNASDVLDCLRTAPIDVLAKAQDASLNFSGSGVVGWIPVIDGHVFVDTPANLIQQGKFARVPLMAGASTNESIGPLPGQTLGEVLTAFYPRLSQADIDEFQTFYSKFPFPNQGALVNTALGEILLRCGRETLGNAGVRYKTNSWTYRYNQASPYDPPDDVEHVAELWMLYPGFANFLQAAVVLTPAQIAFGDELRAYWISFVRASDPNVYKLARSSVWPGFEHNVRVVLQMAADPGYLNSTDWKSGVVLETEPVDEAERCQFIAERSSLLQT